MELLSLCEPLFQYICTARRSAHKGRPIQPEVVQLGLRRLLRRDLPTAAKADPHLAEQFDAVRLPLVFFADYMIRTSRLPFADQWSPLAHEDAEYAGDEKFFALLQKELSDTSPAATERLVVYHNCLGLGFTGIYSDDLEKIRRFMARIAVRISDQMNLEERAHVCPNAYEHVDKRDFHKPLGPKLIGWGLVWVVLFILWLAVTYLSFFWASHRVRVHAGTIFDSNDVKVPGVSGSTK